MTCDLFIKMYLFNSLFFYVNLSLSLSLEIGQVETYTLQIQQMETILSSERSERARSETKASELQGQLMYQDGDHGEHLRNITSLLNQERKKVTLLENKLNESQNLINEQKSRAEKFELMTQKYTNDLHVHENNIEELRASRHKITIGSSGSGGNGEDEEEEE